LKLFHRDKVPKIPEFY